MEVLSFVGSLAKQGVPVRTAISPPKTENVHNKFFIFVLLYYLFQFNRQGVNFVRQIIEDIEYILSLWEI